jgi:hypothetical protein
MPDGLNLVDQGTSRSPADVASRTFPTGTLRHFLLDWPNLKRFNAGGLGAPLCRVRGRKSTRFQAEWSQGSHGEKYRQLTELWSDPTETGSNRGGR